VATMPLRLVDRLPMSTLHRGDCWLGSTATSLRVSQQTGYNGARLASWSQISGSATVIASRYRSRRQSRLTLHRITIHDQSVFTAF
jgi:hypothetical protein